MRIRTLFALAVGAVAGAGITYLLDPDQGSERRRQARSELWRRARDLDLPARARRSAAEAAEGFRAGLAASEGSER